MVVEPVLQGAGGMHAYSPYVVRVLASLAREHGALVIFDEIATGFGRTGTLWAADRCGVVPDIMCVGKALTGGYLTLAATLCTAEVAEGVSGGRSGGLMHGPTFMGNPLACSVALASLDLLEKNDVLAQTAALQAGLTTGLAPARELGSVARRARPRRGRRDPAARAGPTRRGRRRGDRARRLGAPVPRPRLHHAAVRHRRATTWPPCAAPSSAPWPRRTDDRPLPRAADRMSRFLATSPRVPPSASGSA